MEDFAQVMRRLWHGELIFNHDGPIGKYQLLFLDPDFREDIRWPSSHSARRRWRGAAASRRCHPAHLLHPETLQRAVQTVRMRRAAGRDPAAVRVWSCFATVGDHLPEELRLKKTVARLATYLQGYGDLLVKTNAGIPPCWPGSGRCCGAVDSGGIDHKPAPSRSSTSPPCCRRVAGTRGDGSARQCVDRIRKEFDYGADAVICTVPRAGRAGPIVASTAISDLRKF
jgi:alkanesulfonate monooxygenase SsuD/methylene tetrahydromethanopterin reductase-like flavin-dependent oxidoreductase (luciferase family)